MLPLLFDSLHGPGEDLHRHNVSYHRFLPRLDSSRRSHRLRLMETRTTDNVLLHVIYGALGNIDRTR